MEDRGGNTPSCRFAAQPRPREEAVRLACCFQEENGLLGTGRKHPREAPHDQLTHT